MDKRQLFDTFEKVAQDTERTFTQINTLKKAVDELLEKNAALEMENQHLRSRLQELQVVGEKTVSDEISLSVSKQNLEKIYEDGFHVCNVAYGSRRENDEPCAFCLEVIYGERQ